MSGHLSREGIALLEHMSEQKAPAVPRTAPIATALRREQAANREAAYRLFTGNVRHQSLSAEDAAPLLKTTTPAAADALDELVRAGALVLNGSMYELPRAAARELPPTVDLSAAARDLGARGGAKGGHARAAALTPERRTEIARVAACARAQKARATSPATGLPPAHFEVAVPAPAGDSAERVPGRYVSETRPGIEKLCRYEQCGKTFEAPRTHGRQLSYCTPRCRRDAMNDRQSIARAEANKAFGLVRDRAAGEIEAESAPPAPAVPAVAPGPVVARARRQVLTVVSMLPTDVAAALLADLLNELCQRRMQLGGQGG
jgi:hypothetical protein